MLSEEDRATAIGNMHKNFGEDRTSSTGDMTQTDKQTCGQQTLPSSIRLSTSQTRREPKALSEPISDTVIGSPVQVQVSRSAFCVGLTVVTDRQTDHSMRSNNNNDRLTAFDPGQPG